MRISKNGMHYKKRQLWLDTIEDWSSHELRRTLRTGLARLKLFIFS